MRIKNKGRHDIYNKWSAIEDKWVDIVMKQSGDDSCQWVKPEEHLSYQMPQKPFEIFEEDFRKTAMDYLMFQNGVDTKKFGEKLLNTVMYSSSVSSDDVSVTVNMQKDGDNDGKRTRKIVNRILRMIKDIEGTYSAKLDLQSAGIGSLKIICGLGTEVSHNALDDAVDLKNIISHIDLKGCSEHMLQIMKKYTSEKEVYYRLRRFREKWDDVSEGIQEKSLSLLKELGKVDTVEARALRDDLLVMCTGEAMAFPTLEEYIQKGNAKTGKVICDKNDK